jgi:signal peptidase I
MALKKSPPAANPKGGGRKKPFWQEYGEALVIALVLALVIRAFLVQAFSIPSGSMQPTLLIGDYLLVNKFIYGIRNPFSNKMWIPISSPRRGDIVVFIFPQDPSKDYIKRVIGLPGDTVQIINKKVYLNGRQVETPQAVYTDPSVIPATPNQHRDNFGPVTVPPDSFFVMGDNRDQSYDSRFWGFVSMDALRGKAFVIYFSWQGQGQPGMALYQAFAKGASGLLHGWHWDRQSFRVRWDRIGRLIN